MLRIALRVESALVKNISLESRPGVDRVDRPATVFCHNAWDGESFPIHWDVEGTAGVANSKSAFRHLPITPDCLGPGIRKSFAVAGKVEARAMKMNHIARVLGGTDSEHISKLEYLDSNTIYSKLFSPDRKGFYLAEGLI